MKNTKEKKTMDQVEGKTTLKTTLNCHTILHPLIETCQYLDGFRPGKEILIFHVVQDTGHSC
jgi:hypothetical protein